MTKKRRSRRRDRRRGAAAQAETVKKMVQPIHNMPLYEVVDEAGLNKIHNKSLEILSDVGVAIFDEEAQAIFKDHGAVVKDEMVYLDPDTVMEYVSKAPSEFTQIARNPDNNVVIGGNRMCFSPVYGPPFVYDIDRGRREATLADFQNFVKLAYMSRYMHHSGGTVCEPTDEPTHTRHLDMVYAHMKYSDKAFMGSVTSGVNAQDTVDMCKILFGEEAIMQNPATVSLINVSSPRRYDERMLEALKVYARNRQAMIVTPFILSGAMAPVSVAGTVAQVNAEALAGIALVQMINPGCPIIYGSFQTNIDLQSGAPVFGSAESQIALYAVAQLARMHNLPFRSGGMFASSKVADAQAAYESVMVMLPAVMARVNFVLHAAGWLEGGLAAGYEKFVMDCELLGMFHKYMEGFDLSEDAFAMDSMRSVPPGGHHLGTDHTIRNFRTAFHRSELFDYNSAEQWQEEGSLTSEQVANKKYKQLLRDYKAPTLDPAIDQALLDFIAKRKTEIEPEF